MDLTILHASDIHCGKFFDPGAAGAFWRFLEPLALDLVVLSGDFTQRAKVREYEAARGFLKGLEPNPVVVTPGNHDVPLYRFWERLLVPHRNYRTFISRELDTVTRIPGATVVALNSTAPRSAIVNGRIGKDQLRFAAASFRDADEGDIRILVAHHNLAKAPADESGKILPGSRGCLSAFFEMGVDLILGGHLHQTFWASSLGVLPNGKETEAIPIVHTGTTTSRRGRAAELGRNSLNLIRISKEEVRVKPHLLDTGTETFQPGKEACFPQEKDFVKMSRFYRRTPPGRKENLGAGLISAGLALGVASVSFYLVRTFLAREPLPELPPRKRDDGNPKRRHSGAEEGRA